MESLEQIAECVRRVTGYDLEALRVKKRDTLRVAERQVFCYFARKQNYSLSEIGKFIGIDHATVIHSVRMIEEKRETDDIIEYYVRRYEVMSNKKQIIEIEPPSHNQVEEKTTLVGFACPQCNGRGWVMEYDVREGAKIDCSRCSGCGRLTATVVVSWKAENESVSI